MASSGRRFPASHAWSPSDTLDGRCDACQCACDIFMVDDSLWQSLVRPGETSESLRLCVACTERRLQRALDVPDLATVPANAWLYLAMRERRRRQPYRRASEPALTQHAKRRFVRARAPP